MLTEEFDVVFSDHRAEEVYRVSFFVLLWPKYMSVFELVTECFVKSSVMFWQPGYYLEEWMLSKVGVTYPLVTVAYYCIFLVWLYICYSGKWVVSVDCGRALIIQENELLLLHITYPMYGNLAIWLPIYNYEPEIVSLLLRTSYQLFCGSQGVSPDLNTILEELPFCLACAACVKTQCASHCGAVIYQEP